MACTLTKGSPGGGQSTLTPPAHRLLRGSRHEPGLDDRIVQAAVDGYTGRINQALNADFRALYPLKGTLGKLSRAVACPGRPVGAETGETVVRRDV